MVPLSAMPLTPPNVSVAGVSIWSRLHVRHVHCRRQDVVKQRGRQKLSGVVVDDPFHQRRTQSLDNRTMGLPFHDQRVHHTRPQRHGDQRCAMVTGLARDPVHSDLRHMDRA